MPTLLEKVLERGLRAVVMTGSPERAEALTQQLWTYKEQGFLPHGNVRDGFAADQPIWLTADDENPNKAQVLMLVDGASTDELNYDMVCEIFDGNNGDALDHSRARWKNYKAQGQTPTYWQQGPKGWEKKGD